MGDKKMARYFKKFAIVFLSILFLSTITSAITIGAEDVATVVVMDSVGGTVDPTGTNTYTDGQTITFTATPSGSDFVFSNWIVTSDNTGNTYTDNPLDITMMGGVTYVIQAFFDPVQPIPGRPPPSDLSNAAIVVVLASAGGTTSPAPGTYALANAENFDIIATPNSGWQFSHWTIYGVDTGHGSAPANWNPTNNPYNVNHGYGATYSYQAVFTPIGSTEPHPTSTTSIAGMSNDTLIIIVLAVVIVVLLIAVGYLAMKRKK
jgi:hypothetical protein